MGSEDRHWVETLFPPAFGFTVDELLSELDEKNETEKSMFDRLASSVRPIDTAAIKNVYHRVWLMVREEALQREEKEHIQDETIPQVQHAETSTRDLPVDVGDECIWSSSEIQVLRDVFQAARQENQDLKASLIATEKSLGQVDEKYKGQRSVMEKQQHSLLEASKANTRLHIMTENLKTQLSQLRAQITSMEEEIETLKSDRAKYMKEAHETTVKYNEEKLVKAAVTNSLKQQTQQSLQQQILREEQLKLSYDRETSSLRRKLARVQQELENERKEHSRTKRGLEHLRTHFASLPFSGEGDMVVEDQLKSWTR